MRILIVIKSGPVKRFLVDLHTTDLVEEVARLVYRKRHASAIATALAKGRFQREITEAELPRVRATFILTEENVSWDLMQK